MPQSCYCECGLSGIPGVTESEIAALLHTDDGPRWLVGGSDREREKVLPKFSVVREGNIRVVISLEAPASTIHPDDVGDLQEILARTVALSLRDIKRSGGLT